MLMLIVLRYVSDWSESTVLLCVVCSWWSTSCEVLLILVYGLAVNLVNIKRFLIALLLLQILILSLIKAAAHDLELGLGAGARCAHHRMLLWSLTVLLMLGTMQVNGCIRYQVWRGVVGIIFNLSRLSFTWSWIALYDVHTVVMR